MDSGGSVLAGWEEALVFDGDRGSTWVGGRRRSDAADVGGDDRAAPSYV